METSLNDEDMLKNLNFELDFVFLVHGWQSEFNVDKKGKTFFFLSVQSSIVEKDYARNKEKLDNWILVIKRVKPISSRTRQRIFFPFR